MPGSSDAIPDLLRARRVRAVRAAVELAARLDAVADDVAAAVLAVWRERLDRTLEAVEHVVRPRRDHLEGLVVLVSTHFAVPWSSLLLACCTIRCECLVRTAGESFAGAGPNAPMPFSRAAEPQCAR